MTCSVRLSLGSRGTLYFSVMDPLNRVDVMHLQESLDLSVGCRRSPVKTNSMEGLDLVKKPSWCGITSGSKSVNMSESRYISKHNSPDRPEPGPKHHGSRTCGTSSHGPCSVPSPLINGLPSVAHHRPTTDQAFADDSDHRMEMEDVLTQTKNGLKKADSVLGGRMHPQDMLTSCGETYLRDTLSKGSSCLPQDASTAAYTLRSTSSASIETLASECTGAKRTSPRSVEFVSSADDSDVIEVPVSNSRCKTPPSCRFRTHSVIVTERRRGNSSVKQEAAMDCSPKHVNNVCALDEAEFEARDGKADSESKSLLSWMESVCIPISPEDSDQDMDAAFPKNFPSTSDAENTSVFKSPQSGASSSASSRQRKTPASKSRKRAKPRPKKPAKRVRAPPAGKSAKRRRRKPRSSGPPSMFSSQEPEIELKFAKHKEEKKDSRPDGFTPYVHMEFSSCTVVSFREEDVYSTKKGSQQVVSGVIPKTSCLQLGRVGSDARSQVRRFCCLCGRAGNVEGLGDLHGPYCSSGAQAVCKSDSSPPAQKQEPDCSDLDSLYSLEDGASQSVRRQRKENCSESVDCSEHWIHEDCSIWTAGIFLVKGKLYGLEEAVRLAQGTVCSYCHMVGATLGCFFKDCPNKYHFPCALQSDSALNEENFTIRCPKHKNKTSRASVSRLKNR
uniref:Si:ch211-165g14.1 n=1 Tax=Cyprinus carpio TaxID=7962 RepID=A0A8C1NDX1_CYPCA